MSSAHLFVMDPLASLNLPLDSSLRMMTALARHGHTVYLAEPRDIAWGSGRSGAHARCQQLTFKDFDAKTATAAPAKTMALAEFRAVHMRKDPPYDLDYITTTWLLDAAGPRTKIYNSPSALRALNEKLAILRLVRDGDADAALVSASPSELLEFIKNDCGGDAVVKPLHLFGGRGVEHVKVTDDRSALTQLTALTEGGKSLRLAQRFNPAVFAGEVRVFTAFGEPIAWCLKKPKAGEFLANTRAGATLHAYTPTKDEDARVRRVATTLGREGVALIGFDLIGGQISEVNITSPRMLVGPDAPAGAERAAYDRIAALMLADLK
jgi:glutathione synthase